MTSRHRCRALTNRTVKQLALKAGHLWVLLMRPWGVNDWWNVIWNISNIELRMWNQISYDPHSYERKFSSFHRQLQKLRSSLRGSMCNIFHISFHRYECLLSWLVGKTLVGAKTSCNDSLYPLNYAGKCRINNYCKKIIPKWMNWQEAKTLISYALFLRFQVFLSTMESVSGLHFPRLLILPHTFNIRCNFVSLIRKSTC